MNGLANLLLLLTGLGGGILVAGGLFAFLALIGVVTRLAAGTKTAKFLMFYEDDPTYTSEELQVCVE